jgi:hypothetical protein
MPTRPGQKIPTAERIAAPAPARGALTPEDIDEEWFDTMVKKLFSELERQLAQVAKSKPPSAAARAADARTLSALERTLERLAKLERERVAVRERKVTRLNDNARQTLERRLDQLLGPAGADEISREPRK